jgi:hypothetical protein
MNYVSDRTKTVPLDGNVTELQVRGKICQVASMFRNHGLGLPG